MQLIKLNKGISILYHNDNLIIKNCYTHVLLDTCNIIKNFIIFDQAFLKLFTICRKNNLIFYHHLSSITRGVCAFFYKKLNLNGIGFRCWVTKKRN
jgi:hypothetical protein